MSAGIVKMTPAAMHSPALALTVARLTSRIVGLNGLSRAKDMTAPGIIADTVMPAYKPR